MLSNTGQDEVPSRMYSVKSLPTAGRVSRYVVIYLLHFFALEERIYIPLTNRGRLGHKSKGKLKQRSAIHSEDRGNEASIESYLLYLYLSWNSNRERKNKVLDLAGRTVEYGSQN